MNHSDNQTQREAEFAGWCASPSFWGVVLVATGLLALLPDNLSRYAWSVLAIGSGIWLLFGPLGVPRSRRTRPDYEHANQI